MSETKKDKLVTRVLRDMTFLAFLSLTFNFDITFQYIKTCIPSKIPRGGGRGVWEGLGMDKIMGFYISPYLMFAITFFSVMHFHNHLCISISPKILKEIFAEKRLALFVWWCLISILLIVNFPLLSFWLHGSKPFLKRELFQIFKDASGRACITSV